MNFWRGVRVFESFKYNGFWYLLETNIRFLMAIIVLSCLYFLMIDVKEFVSDVVTSLTLCALITRFGTMLAKHSLKVSASAFSDLMTADFSIRGTVLHILTLFPNTGLTAFQNFCVSIALCKSKFS